MKNSILLYIKLIIYNSEFLYSGGNKFQLMMILQHEFNESTDFWLNSVWNNYKHFISLILAVAYFLSCDFEKLMLYVLSHVQCPHGKILNPVAIWNYSLYLIKNYYTFKGYYTIKTINEKKLN